MSVTLLGALLLGVSLVSVMVYMVALGQLLINEHQPGLLRTAACRLFAALLYVAVGLITVVTNDKGPLIGLGVFTAVQLIWQANSIADVLLVRKRKGKQMHEKPEPPGVTAPVPNYAQPLSDFVASAEIEKLFERQNALSREFDRSKEAREKLGDRQRYWQGLSVFSTVLAICGLAFGLVTFSRADHADELAQQNTVFIAELRETQTLLATSVRETCVLYDQLVSTYSPRSRAAFPRGPEGYDEEFRRMLASATNLRCGLTPPRDLPR